MKKLKAFHMPKKHIQLIINKMRFFQLFTSLLQLIMIKILLNNPARNSRQ